MKHNNVNLSFHLSCNVCLCRLQQPSKSKKEEGKRSRMDKDKVTDMLFSAFEKHQYYNVKDLVRITDQPIVSTYSIIYSKSRPLKGLNLLGKMSHFAYIMGQSAYYAYLLVFFLFFFCMVILGIKTK